MCVRALARALSRTRGFIRGGVRVRRSPPPSPRALKKPRTRSFFLKKKKNKVRVRGLSQQHRKSTVCTLRRGKLRSQRAPGRRRGVWGGHRMSSAASRGGPRGTAGGCPPRPPTGDARRVPGPRGVSERQRACRARETARLPCACAAGARVTVARSKAPGPSGRVSAAA